MRHVRIGLALIVLVSPACSRPDSSAPRAGAAPKAPGLQIAAASDLHDALPEVVRGFKQAAPGVSVVTTFGPSGQLARQVEAGAPFGLFLSANERFVRDLARDGRVVAASVRPYAIGSLVVVHRPGLRIATLADLTAPGVKRLVIANPKTAPYGAAAKQALEKAEVWGKVEPRLAVAETVLQAFVHVKNGDAEAGLVGKAVARGAGASGLEVVEVDPKLHDPIVQVLGVVEGSTQAAEAERFARFLLGPEGRRVLTDHGFALPPAP